MNIVTNKKPPRKRGGFFIGLRMPKGIPFERKPMLRT